MARLEPRDIAQLRLRNQQIHRQAFDKPADLVRWFGAVQAQEFTESLWAVGLRTRGAVQADVEHAIATGQIVRSWPMRNTLHFVAREDLRWMLQLLAPRMIAATATRHRQLELDDRTFSRAEKVIVPALTGGRHLTRPALYSALGTAGIATQESRGLHILAHLSLKSVLCFGPRVGKQPTFVLLDEWLPNAQPLAREVALAELALRYFTSHGPASVHDFAWWAGLTVGDARAGVESAKARLVSETIDGRQYWLVPPARQPRRASTAPSAHLLPSFDEYTVAYRDRSAVLDPVFGKRVNAGGGIFKPIVVIDGQVVGTWSRAIEDSRIAITATPFARFTKPQWRALEAAAGRFARFVGLPYALN